MPLPPASEINESRTRTVGTKRSAAATDSETANKPSKRRKTSRPAYRDVRDFVPSGGSFSNAPDMDQDTTDSSEAASSTGSTRVSRAQSPPTAGMDWNTTVQVAPVTPRLQASSLALGENRLVSGFSRDRELAFAATSKSRSLEGSGESADNTIEISDDSDMHLDSEDGGMMINVEDNTKAPSGDEEEQNIGPQAQSAFSQEASPGQDTDSDIRYFVLRDFHVLRPRGATDADIFGLRKRLIKLTNGERLVLFRTIRSGDDLLFGVAKEYAAKLEDKGLLSFAGKDMKMEPISTAVRSEVTDVFADPNSGRSGKVLWDLQRCPTCGSMRHKQNRCPKGCLEGQKAQRERAAGVSDTEAGAQTQVAATSAIDTTVSNTDLRYFQIADWKTLSSSRTRYWGIKSLRGYLEQLATPSPPAPVSFEKVATHRKHLIIAVSSDVANRIAHVQSIKIDKRQLPMKQIQSVVWPGESFDSPAYMNAETLRICQTCNKCRQLGHYLERCPAKQGREANISDGAADELLQTQLDRQLTTDDPAVELHPNLNREPESEPTQEDVPLFTADNIPAVVRLANLSADELEKQVRYTLFHLNRDQIDLSRLAVCMTCLQEGHLAKTCPENNCVHCGGQNQHSSRTCPKYRLCLRCRQRGHDSYVCTSKLIENGVPCDLCGLGDHFENKCPQRYFPVQTPASDKLDLWVSCCNCGSDVHLVGDCPELLPRTAQQAAAWSLRTLNHTQINNLSLATGTRRLEKEALNRNMRPQSLNIRGRANQYSHLHPNRDDDDDEEPFLRQPVGRRNDSPRKSNHIRFSEREAMHDMYRPAPDYRSDAPAGRDRPDMPEHRSPPLNRDDRNNRRAGYYDTDSFGRQRRRSRSPDFNSHRAAPPGVDRWQPPLPREPPPPSYHPLPAKPAQSGDSYRPMPSSAKQAWQKGRL